MFDAHRVSQSRWLQRILTWVRGPRLPARTTLGVDPARLYKVSITGVRHTLVTRRTVAADGGPEHRPAEPRRNLTPRDPDSGSRTSAHLAAFTALNMLLTLLSGPEPKSGQTPARQRARGDPESARKPDRGQADRQGEGGRGHSREDVRARHVPGARRRADRGRCPEPHRRTRPCDRRQHQGELPEPVARLYRMGQGQGGQRAARGPGACGRLPGGT